MRSLGTAVLALLIATAAQAQESQHPSFAQPAAPSVPVAASAPAPAEPSAEAPAAPEVPEIEPRLAEEERAAAPETDDAVAQPFTRGSFWWYVGIIVVAGVILAVVL